MRMKRKEIVFCNNSLTFLVEELRDDGEKCANCDEDGLLYYLIDDQRSEGLCYQCLRKQYIMVKNVATMEKMVSEIVESANWTRMEIVGGKE